MQRLYTHIRLVVFGEDRFRQQRFTRWIAVDVQCTTTIQVPRELLVGKILIVRIVPGTQTNLTNIIPGGPHEIANEVGELFHHLPVFSQLEWEGLTAHDHTFWMQVTFQRIAFAGIVVSSNVKGIQYRRSHLVHHRHHHGIHHPLAGGHHHLVILFAGHRTLSAHLCRVSSREEVLSHTGETHDHDVDASGYRTRGIFLMQASDQVLCQSQTLFLSRFTHLVANAVHDHAGVIEIVLHKATDILLIVGTEVVAIVILSLGDVPHVPQLIHHIHTQFVASLQQCLRSRVVRDTDGVETILLHDSHLAKVGILILRSTQNAIIVVDAATLQQHLLPIHQQTILGVPTDLTNTKTFLLHLDDLAILLQLHHSGVEIWMLSTPKLSTFHRELHLVALSFSHLRVSLKEAHTDFTPLMRGLHSHLCRSDGKRTDAHVFDIVFLLHAEHHRTIDTSATVPATVGHLRVVHIHADHVLTSFQQTIQTHLERHVAILVAPSILSIHQHLAVAIYTIELQCDVLLQHVRRGVECLFIVIHVARIESVVTAFGHIRTTCLCLHGIMRKVYHLTF